MARWAIAAHRLAKASRDWVPNELDGLHVWMTENIGPAVSGIFRPRVLVPAWLLTLPAPERALVLMHEQEHIRARDPLLIAFTRAARILTPWNPVVWLLSSRLVRAVELDCDRRVLRRTEDVAAYGHTLLTVSARRPSPLVLAAAFAESEAPLRSRILAMTTPSRTVSVAAIMASTVLGVVLLVGALQIPVPAVSVAFSVGPQPDPTPTVTAFDTPPGPPEPAEADLTIISRIPTPPPPPPAPTSVAAGTSEPLTQEPIPQPRFTPMSVRPALLNAEEVQQALTREYPPVLRDAGVGGAPVLWIYIGDDGAVRRTEVVESSGHAALDEAARKVAEVMRFTPARNRDQEVAVWVQIPIRFQVVN